MPESYGRDSPSPIIEDFGRVMVASQVPPGPVDLIHHFLESKRSKALQKPINLEIGASSNLAAAEECSVSEDCRVSVVSELGNLAIGEGKIEATVDSKCLDRAKCDPGDFEETESSKSFGNKSGSLEFEENAKNLHGNGTRKSGRNSGYGKGSKLPVRPDAEDCSYYMKFGSCKYGISCKFNHPLRRNSQVSKERLKYKDDNPEKAGQAECKYYFTSGGCKHGNHCRFSHGSDKSFAPQILGFNLKGFPIRPGENECPYYMRTGSCKYGANCRFNHPEPDAISRDFSSSKFSSGDLQTSQPVSIPQGQSFTFSNSEWNGHQAANYTYESGLPIPPAFSMNGCVSAGIYFPTQNRPTHLFDEYPERPREPECDFFMKTGDCKFKSTCKFHHPKNRISKAKLMPSTSSLNDNGLPLRADQPICKYYYRFGICKFGPVCQYDHSSKMGDGAGEER